MKIKRVLVFSITALTLALNACAPAASGDAMTEKPTEDMMTEAMTEPAMTEAMTEDAMLNETATPEAMMDAPVCPPHACEEALDLVRRDALAMLVSHLVVHTQ